MSNLEKALAYLGDKHCVAMQQTRLAERHVTPRPIPLYIQGPDRVALWAARNGELHVLCRKLLDKYRAAAPDDPDIWGIEQQLCDIPQERRLGEDTSS